MPDEPRDVFAEYIESPAFDLSKLGWTVTKRQQTLFAEMEEDLAIVREVPAELLVDDLEPQELWLIGKLLEIPDLHMRLLVAISTLKLYFGYGGQDAVL